MIFSDVPSCVSDLILLICSKMFIIVRWISHAARHRFNQAQNCIAWDSRPLFLNRLEKLICVAEMPSTQALLQHEPQMLDGVEVWAGQRRCGH